jgi:uncharacterized damage-inducible protein DinB
MTGAPDHLARLYAHLRWADERALRALRAAPAPEPHATELYAHMVAAEHVWLARVRGEPARVSVWPAPDLDAMARLAAETHAALDALVSAADDAALAREVAYVNSAGEAFRSRLDDILLHVALHGAYHRGQIAASLRRSGAEPIATDYIAFARGAPAAVHRPDPRR